MCVYIHTHTYIYIYVYTHTHTLENRGKESTTKVPEEEPTGRKKGRWLT